MRKWRIVLGVCLSFAAVQACGSDEPKPGSATSSSSGTGGSGGDPTPADSCVRPGDKGNVKGVGEYCTPFGGECSAFAGAPLCLADVGQDQWMCTRIGCKVAEDCGEGAGCLITPEGSACVPCRCSNEGLGCPGGMGGMGGMGGSGGMGGTGGMGGAGGM
jgi:hypothetical protein